MPEYNKNLVYKAESTLTKAVGRGGGQGSFVCPQTLTAAAPHTCAHEAGLCDAAHLRTQRWAAQCVGACSPQS